jgi:hypothetical protein
MKSATTGLPCPSCSTETEHVVNARSTSFDIACPSCMWTGSFTALVRTIAWPIAAVSMSTAVDVAPCPNCNGIAVANRPAGTATCSVCYCVFAWTVPSVGAALAPEPPATPVLVACLPGRHKAYESGQYAGTIEVQTIVTYAEPSTDDTGRPVRNGIHECRWVGSSQTFVATVRDLRRLGLTPADVGVSR